MNKKKILGTLGITGLVVTVPFAAFAGIDSNTTDTNNGFNIENKFNKHHNRHLVENSLLEETEYDMQIVFLEKKIERKIENANLILENIDVDDDTKDKLNEIITEFTELETFLESIDISEEESDYLKEIYLEQKAEEIELTSEFRDIIQTSLTEDEIEDIKLQLRDKEDKQIESKHNNGFRNFDIEIETLEIISLELAQSYENGELSKYEVMKEIKEIIDSLSEEEKEELFEELEETGSSMSFDNRRAGREKRGNQI